MAWHAVPLRPHLHVKGLNTPMDQNQRASLRCRSTTGRLTSPKCLLERLRRSRDHGRIQSTQRSICLAKTPRLLTEKAQKLRSFMPKCRSNSGNSKPGVILMTKIKGRICDFNSIDFC